MGFTRIEQTPLFSFIANQARLCSYNHMRRFTLKLESTTEGVDLHPDDIPASELLKTVAALEGTLKSAAEHLGHDSERILLAFRSSQEGSALASFHVRDEVHKTIRVVEETMRNRSRDSWGPALGTPALEHLGEVEKQAQRQGWTASFKSHGRRNFVKVERIPAPDPVTVAPRKSKGGTEVYGSFTRLDVEKHQALIKPIGDERRIRLEGLTESEEARIAELIHTQRVRLFGVAEWSDDEIIRLLGPFFVEEHEYVTSEVFRKLSMLPTGDGQ